MAKGKFFNGKVKKDRSGWIKYGLIAGGAVLIILLFVFIGMGKDKNKEVVLQLKGSITVEVNSEKPKTSEYFEKIKNYKERNITIGDYDISTVGSYEVEVKTKNQGTASIMVNVVDTTAPELEVKDFEIKHGETYKVEDFITSCSDNSKTNCIIEYYDGSLDENGNAIDYSSFNDPGEYVIMIVAKDEHENATVAKEVKLTIIKEEPNKPDLPIDKPEPEPDPEPIECQYGDLTVDEKVYPYPIAVIVGDQNAGCALDRNLWDHESVQTAIDKVFDTDNKNLRKELDPIFRSKYPSGAKIVAKPVYKAILNAENKGLVGYAIRVDIYVIDAKSYENVDEEKNLKLSYYLNSDLTRTYEVNEFNL